MQDGRDTIIINEEMSAAATVMITKHSEPTSQRRRYQYAGRHQSFILDSSHVDAISRLPLYFVIQQPIARPGSRPTHCVQYTACDAVMACWWSRCAGEGGQGL